MSVFYSEKIERTSGNHNKYLSNGMKLYFKCPKENATFASDDYTLQKGHRIVEDEHGVRTLEGMVSLNSGCPLCGGIHLYEAKEVLCPLSEGKNGE